MVRDRRAAARLLAGGAALAALAIGTLGCSSKKDTSPTLAPLESEPSTTAIVTTTVAASTASTAGAETATSAPIDGAALLNAALDSIAAGYHFTNTVSVDGAVVLTADGDRVGDGTRVGVVRDNVAVQYIITPEGTWVQPEGGDWEQLDTPAATTDPIGALRTPTSVTVTGVNGTSTTLDVTVPATSLGIAGEGSVVVSPVIDQGTIKAIVYNTTVDGRPATVQAVIGAVVDSTPVVPPA
jgi:hypothetical protein